MTRFRLLAAAALAAAAVAAPSASANTIINEYIEDTLDGCYGVGVVICDPHLTGTSVGFTRTDVPVCVRTCQTVGVPVPSVDSSDRLCVASTDQNGSYQEICVYDNH